MKNYSSRPFVMQLATPQLFQLCRTPLSLQPLLSKWGSKLPVKNVQLAEESIELEAPVVGHIKLARTEEVAPHLVRYTGVDTPVPLILTISLSEAEASSSNVQFSVDIDVPMFFAGAVKSKLEPALEQVATMLEGLDFSKLKPTE